ncbi:MAG: peptidylprolyl isomerase [Acetobacter sp.]|nr:peptidylprolyl isomerase [Acetobacter sp.]
MNKTLKLTAMLLILSASANAAGKKADADMVVATVNGVKITLSDMQDVKQMTNPQIAALPMNAVFEPLLDNLINTQVVAQAAKEAKIQDSAEYKKMMKSLENQILMQLYLKQQAQKMQTKAKLTEMYEQYKRNNPPQEEMSAAHILLKTEKEARDVIKQLEKGADFADLANKLSENKGLEGGDLGYFTRELMVPEFSEAAFRMKEGEISKTPVKTQFGWHIIKAGPRRLTEVPSFEEMEKELTQMQATEAVEEIVTGLRKKAKIVTTPVRFDAQGNVVK